MSIWLFIGVFVAVDLVVAVWFMKRGLPRINAVNGTPEDVVPYQPTLDVSGAEPRSVFVGGATLEKVSAGGAVVRLQIDHDGLQFGPRWGWLRLIPRVRLRWDQIDRVVMRDGGYAFTRSPAIDVVTRHADVTGLVRFVPKRGQMHQLLHQFGLHRSGLVYREAASSGGR